MSLSCSIKFSPHSVKAEQVQEVIVACHKAMFKERLTSYGRRNENGRVDWLISYYSSDPKKEGLVYSITTLRLNAQGHTLGFNIGAKTSAFNRWITCYLTNEIALRLNGLIRAEGHQPQDPHPISPTLSTFLTDTYGKLPHHMLTEQAGAFPPEFALEDNWIHGHKNQSGSDLPTVGVSGLEAEPNRQTLDERKPFVQG